MNPCVIWLTGLSGAGKTTLAKFLYDDMIRKNIPVQWLDGDRLRSHLPKLGFSREDRNQHIQNVGQMARDLEKEGFVVICSFISPYAEARQSVRQICRHFVEVYVSTPLAECERRDPKGLYARVRGGEIKGFTGVDDPYEIPRAPELEMDTTAIPLPQAAQIVFDYLHLHVRKDDVRGSLGAS